MLCGAKVQFRFCDFPLGTFSQTRGRPSGASLQSSEALSGPHIEERSPPAKHCTGSTAADLRELLHPRFQGAINAPHRGHRNKTQRKSAGKGRHAAGSAEPGEGGCWGHLLNAMRNPINSL